MATVADLQIIVTSETGDAEAGLGRVDEKINKAAASTALLGAARVSSDIFTGAVMGAADFEAIMIDLQIATNTADEDMAALEQTVMSLGEAFPYSAQEVGALMTEIAKAGMVGDELEEMTTAVLMLATGIGEDLIPTFDMLKVLLQTVGDSFDSPMDAANQLFKVLGAGTLDLHDIQEAWKSMGGVLESTGVSFLEAAGWLTVLVGAGTSASTAGEVLSKVFAALKNPVGDVADALTSLGVAFKDSEGNFLSVHQIMLNLAKVWKDIDDFQTKKDFAKLIGGDQWENVMALFDAGVEAFNKFKTAYESAMSLPDAMKKKMSGAKAMWDTFMEAVNSVSLVMGQQLLPAFKSVIGIITPLVSGIKTLNPSILQTVGIIGLLVTALMGIAGVVGIFQTFGIGAAMMGLMLNPVTLLIAGLGLLAGKWLSTGNNMEKVTSIAKRLVDAFQMVSGTGAGPVTAALRAIGIVFPELYGHVLTAISVWETMKSVFSSSVSVIGKVAKAIAKFVKAALEIGVVRDAIVSLAAGFAAFMAMQKAIAVFNSLKTAIIGLRVAVLALNTAFLANPVVLVIAAIVALGVAIYLLYQRFEAVRNVVDPVLNVLKQLGSFLLGVLVGAFNTVMDVMRSLGSALGNLVDAFQALLSGDISGFLSNMGEAFMDLIDAVITAATALPRAIISAFDGVDWAGMGTRALSMLVNAIRAGASGAGDLFGWIGDALSNAISTMRSVVNSGIQLAWNAITSLDWSMFVPKLEWVQWIGGKIADIATWVWDKISGFFPSASVISGTISDIASWVWGKISGFFPAAAVIAGTIADVATWVWGKISGFFPSASVIAGTIADVATWIWGKISGFFPSASVIAGTISDIATWVWEKISGFFPSASVISGTISDIASWVWDKISGFFPSGNVISGTISSVSSWVWGKISSYFPSANVISGTISSVSTWVWGKISSFFPSASVISGTISDVAGWIWGKISSFFPSSQVIATVSLDDILGLFPEIPSFSWPSISKDDILGWIGLGDGGSKQDAAAVAASNQKHDSGLSGTGGGGGRVQQYSMDMGGGGGGGMTSILDALKTVRNAFQETTGYVQTQSGLWVPATQQNTAAMPMVAYNAFSPVPMNANTQFGAVPASASANLSPVGGIISSTLGAAAGIASMALTGLGATANTQFSAVPMAASTNLAPVGGIVGSTLGGATLAASAALLGMGLAAAVQFAAVPTAATTNLGTLGGLVGGYAQAAAASAAAGFNSLRSSAQNQTAQAAASVASNLAQAAASAASNTAKMAAQVGANAATMAANAIKSATQANTTSSAQMLGMQMGATLASAAMKSNVTSNAASMASAVTAAASLAAAGMRSGMSSASQAVSSAASQWAGMVRAGGGAAAATAAGIGANIGNSLAAGIRSAYGAVAAAAAALVAQADIAMRARARIASPSKMTTYFGEMLGQGLVEGMHDMLRPVGREGSALMGAALHQPSVNTGFNARTLNDPRGGRSVVVYQTNNYTIDVETMHELNDAVDFVSDLERQRQLVFAG